MTTITRDALKGLRIDMDAALAAVGTKHGLSIRAGNCTFSPLNASFKVEICVIEGGEVINKELANLRNMLSILGLSEDHLTQVFTLGGRQYTLAGFKNTGGAKPYLVKRLDNGQTYVVTRQQVATALGLNRRSIP